MSKCLEKPCPKDADCTDNKDMCGEEVPSVGSNSGVGSESEMSLNEKVKIRYKYKPSKYGVRLKSIKCPVCGSNCLNRIMPVNSVNWNGKVILLAECWSGNINIEKPRHLFLIEIDDLPRVYIDNYKKLKKRE